MNDDTDVTVYGIEVVADQGTILVCNGTTEDGTTIIFAGDRRMVIAALDGDPLDDDDEPIPVIVPTWAILGTRRAS